MNIKAKNSKAKFNPLDEDADVQVTFTADEFRDLSDLLRDRAALNLSRYLLERHGSDTEFITPRIDRTTEKLIALLNTTLDRKARSDGSDE